YRLHEPRLGLPRARHEGRHHESEPALDLLDSTHQGRLRSVLPSHHYVPRPVEELVVSQDPPGELFENDVVLVVVFFVGVVVFEEGAEEVGEEVRVEVAEPEEGLLEGVAPVGEEELCDAVVLGGEVEGVVVGVEVGADDVDLGGELGYGGAVDGEAEAWEEAVLEQVEPLRVVLPEWARTTRRFFLAKESVYAGFQHLSWGVRAFSWISFEKKKKKENDEDDDDDDDESSLEGK
ncbi:hypothetical protein PanWU01x14_199960, partial [Parasponia andersonii]